MGHIIADDTLQECLRGILEPVEIRNSAGKVLGHFTPNVTPEERAMYEKAQSLLNLDEINRRLAAEKGQGKPLSEVLEHLRSLETK